MFLFEEADVIYEYTIEDAEKDGVLFNVLQVWEKSTISHITLNLLGNHGYLEGTRVKMRCVAELLQQCIDQMKVKGDLVQDFYEVRVETPKGTRIKAWVEANEIGRMTLMLPEDH